MFLLIPTYQIHCGVMRAKCLGITKTNVTGKRYVPIVVSLNILQMKQIVSALLNALTARKTTQLTHGNARPGIQKKKYWKLSIPGTYHSLKRGKLSKATRQHQVKVMLVSRRLLVSQYRVLMLRHKQTLYLLQQLHSLRRTMLHQPKHLPVHNETRRTHCLKKKNKNKERLTKS